MAALVALVPALAIPVLAACRGGAGRRLPAVLLANAVMLPALMSFSFAVDQSNYADFALTAALLGLPGALLFAVFLERWL